MRKEDIIQQQVKEYLDNQYPNLIYMFTMQGIKLNIGQAMKAKSLGMLNRGFPDLIIFKYIIHLGHPKEGQSPLSKQKTYYRNGLMIELKTEDCLNKDGSIKMTPHVKEQMKIHEELRLGGWEVETVFNFEQAQAKIDLCYGF